jgi:hypothetical protein
MQYRDTRAVEDRIEELEVAETEFLELVDVYADETCIAAAREKAADEAMFPDDDRIELKELREFKDAVEGYCDWLHGEQIIPDDEFADYAEGLAEDIYDVPDHWPFNHIDWGTAAEDLKRDYIEHEGYYVRVC